jgi:cytochrome b pre-mRNA-processing protein 3
MIRKWLQRLGTAPALDTKAAELYNEVVDLARRPEWFAQAGVADDLDGRFDMVVLALALYLVRLERDEADERARAMSSALIERFVADMDGSYREIGIGDMVISKHIGRSLEALGGRLGSYRSALADGAGPDLLAAAIERNVYRGSAAAGQLAFAAETVSAAWQRLVLRPLEELVA